MIGANIRGYIRPCSIFTGGADLLLVGDANDFDFTLGTPGADGEPVGYSTIARRIGSGATATSTVGSGAVTAVNITAGGTNYAAAPTVVFTGGGGTGAAATATIANGVVVAITVTSGGTGYTSAPTVSFTGGGATAAGGAYLYPIDSTEDTIGVDITQANSDGTSSSWDYLIAARLAKMSQAMTNFNVKIDAAAACSQMVFVWRNNDGVIFVAGEKYVNGVTIPKFKFRQDGSKMGTGKKFTDFNGQDLSIKGIYSRAPFEFIGGMGALQAFIPS